MPQKHVHKGSTMKVRETEAERQRRKRAKAEAEGLCIMCYRGQASGGKKSCENCLQRNRQRNQHRKKLQHESGIVKQRVFTTKRFYAEAVDVVDLSVVRWWHFVGGYR